MQFPLVKIKGLYSYPSDLSEVPPGALAVADEIVIDRESVAELRRGFGYLTHGGGIQSNFSQPTYRANKLFFWQNQILAHYDTNLLAYHDPTAGWTNYSGTYNPPSSTVKVRSAQANSNFYFTTAAGVKKIDTYINNPVSAGVPQGLDIQCSIAAQVTPTGTTASSSNVITSVSSVSGVAIGMSITGTNIPANSYISDFNANTITITNNCTGAASGTTLTIGVPSTWLAAANTANTNPNTTCYRQLWTLTDANENLVVGAPTGITTIVNTTGASVAIIVNFSIPAGITTNHYYQIYRSPAVINGALPTDEEQLCYQGQVTAADIAYGSISVLDIVPDTLLGATIYTAPSQQGIAQQNIAVPLALDLAPFRQSLFYGNVQGQQIFELTMLGTGTPQGVQSGDTITIGGVTYTAAASENAATGTFAVTTTFVSSGVTGTTHGTTSITSVSSTTGLAIGQSVSGSDIPANTFITNISGTTVTISQAATGSNVGESLTFTGDSAAQAIRDTALSLVRVINRYASSTVYASYISGPNDLPGKIQIVSRSVGASTFYLISSRAPCWSPQLSKSGTNNPSTSNNFPARVYYSKNGQPEHIAAADYFDVGSDDKQILRIIALRDSLFILKEDGIFYVIGTDTSNFQSWPLDYTTLLIAPDSAVSLNNQIFGLTTQGVVSITQNGSSIMSRPIEDDLTSLIAENYTYLKNTSFGIAYESARAYYLFMPTTASDTQPTQYYRYNYITGNWTHSVLKKRCGGVNPLDDKLYLGNSSLSIIDVENKNLTYTDYADYLTTQTISNISGYTVSISGTNLITAGCVLWQSANNFAIVASVNVAAQTVTTTLLNNLIAGACDVLAPISAVVQWVPISYGNPGEIKHFREFVPLFKQDFAGTAIAEFSSEIYSTTYDEILQGSNIGAYGLFAYGGPDETPLGAYWGGAPKRRPIRVAVPRNNQRATLLNVAFKHSYAYSQWQLQGYSIVAEMVSERTDN